MTSALQKELATRILVLDGAMGTMIQQARLTESDFRGQRFANHPKQLSGNNDILSITCPDTIRDIHRRYLQAGADIISTNSFNANSISQADYGTAHLVEEINFSAAHIAREEADAFMQTETDRRIFVAGSVGPTNRSASISPKVDDPAFRNVDYDDLLKAYKVQIRALVRGGVDIILFETVFDTLNLKAGLEAAAEIAAETGRKLPVMVSATIAGPSGRILSGQTLKAFITSITSYDNVVSVGLNCSWGANEMKPFVEEIAAMTDKAVSCHPNASLPDENGNYSDSPADFAEAVDYLMKGSFVNIVGGCCGTTPEYIALLAEKAAHRSPRKAKKAEPVLRVAGLEALEIRPENNFVNIGERCNVAGSRKFLRLIKEKSYGEALAIALHQVEDGAQIIDVNMDDAMIDASAEMTGFLRLIASDPDIARVPVMIDSSDWNVLESGLKNVQGKCIVNSISLKEGETEFLRKARRIRSFGCAVVVMAFDERGQADTFERKTEICARAYSLLTERAGFAAEDIIFDPNIMAVATGIEEHDLYGRDFIRAVKWIKANLPGAKVSGGVSNLSFAFRGHNSLREAMHAVFLYHAIAAGLDMAIVNPASTVSYEDVGDDLRSLLDDLFINGSHAAAEALSDYADQEITSKTQTHEPNDTDRTTVPVGDRLRESLIKGNDAYLAADIEEAALKYDRAIDIIDGPLMDGVSRVGTLFGEGKMFLPQVVKTARVMKRAVDLLKPRIEAEKADSGTTSVGTIIFATVKGDVHDIGKNIVSIVLECNNYRVIDLGVMVPAETIVEAAIAEKPDIICLSGLITPSLGEMANVADKLEAAGLKIPLIVGGATTSKLHTAIKLAPRLSAPVIHATDASQNPIIAANLLSDTLRDGYISSVYSEYEELRRKHDTSRPSVLPIAEARHRKAISNHIDYTPTTPRMKGVTTFQSLPLKEITPLINWRMLFNFWKLSGNYINDFPFDRCEHCTAQWLARHGDNPKAVEAIRIYDDARHIIERLNDSNIRATIGLFDAWSDSSDNIYIDGKSFPMLRRQEPNADGLCPSLADFVLPRESGKDYVGAFAVTTDAPALAAEFERENDSYSHLLLRSVLDRLAEAASEYLHKRVRTQMWGYADDEQTSPEDLLHGEYQGIRPAMGYPMTPDQLLNHQVAALLPVSEIGVTLTENGAMNPPSTVSGLYISHPAARYFMIGQIGEDQLADYAARRGLDTGKLRPILNKNI